jgi:ATP-dependent exoDNAse (exonuclease V) alpha subunit
LAIYHFAVSVLSRARGHRAVASAAAQAATKLRDEYYGILHNHVRRQGPDFTEILAPAGSPAWVFDREQLWNRVEAAERRKDSQLARVIEISLPVELTHEERIDLLRDFIGAEFVAQGMIADVGIRRTKLENPNAHVLLTLRAVTAAGFGPKMRRWNGKSNLMSWRASWANRANLHLARAGHGLRIDHRTLEEQQIELTPARKTGVSRPLHEVEALPEHLRARYAEQRRIALANGAAIIEDPAIAVRALAHQRRGFTQAQLSQFLRSRTDGDAQHDAALASIMACPELIALSPNDGCPTQYLSRDLIEAQKSLMRRALALAARRPSAAAPQASEAAVMPSDRSQSLREAFSYIVGAGDFKAIGILKEETAGLVSAARAHWHAQGRRVLDSIPPLDREPLGKDEVLVIAGAEMIDLKSLERILAAAERARAKLVLLADAAQLQEMGSRSAMHDLIGVDQLNSGRR